MWTDARTEKDFSTEFSIAPPLDVNQDGGRNGCLPQTCAYAYVAPILISENCDVSLYRRCSHLLKRRLCFCLCLSVCPSQ